MLNQDEVTEKANEIVDSIKEILIKSGQHHKNFDYYKHSTEIAILHVEKIVELNKKWEENSNKTLDILCDKFNYRVDVKPKYDLVIENEQILQNLKERIK